MALKRIERVDFAGVSGMIGTAAGAGITGLLRLNGFARCFVVPRQAATGRGELRASGRLYALAAGVLGSQPEWESMAALARVTWWLGIACPDDLSPSETAQDYTELFVAPGPRYVPPYESAFGDRDSADAVRRIFLAAGLCPERGLPDHIANELRLAAYLCVQEANAPPEEAARAGRLRARLLGEHVANWISGLRRSVAERDEHGYYRAALELAEAVIAREQSGEVARGALRRAAGARG